MTTPLLSRVKLSLWMRLFVAVPSLATAAGIGFSVAASASAPWPLIPVAVGLGVIGATVLTAECRVAVTPQGIRLAYWILFRTHLPAPLVASVVAAEWDSWSYGGLGVKGSAHGEKGLLLNATFNGSGNADRGILITTTDGRHYRVEVPDPAAFADQAQRMLAPV